MLRSGLCLLALGVALAAAGVGAYAALRTLAPATADAAPTVTAVQGKTVAWWARRSVSNGRTARAEAKTIRALRARLRARLAEAVNVYEDAARIAAAAYGVDATTLIRKGRCESTDWTRFKNPRSGAVGPWQFLPSTWRSTPFAVFSPFDPFAAAMGAAWMHAHGRGGEWVCQ